MIAPMTNTPMQITPTPVLKDIVLVGGGHSHVGVLRSFAMQPMPGIRLTLICTDVHTPYSGMLPGYVAGHYGYDDVHIDLWRLAECAGARLYHSEVMGLDLQRKQVLCRNRPAVPYDVLSINIGSTPQLNNVPGAAEHATAVKPVAQFSQRWQTLLQRMENPCPTSNGKKTTIAVVGAGAGGVELLLAMQWRLQNTISQRGADPNDLKFHLFTNHVHILPTHNARVRKHFETELERRKVQVHNHSAVTQVGPGQLFTASGFCVDADEIFWVTQAAGAPWLRDTGLALDEAGFIQVNAHLQSTSNPDVFAAGDTASLIGHRVEKAGVFAVRQGSILATNLRHIVQNKDLKTYNPQKKWLALISTGNQYAVASRGRMYAAGAWVWRWKNSIDRRFMRMYQDLPAMSASSQVSDTHLNLALSLEESKQVASAMAMRCGGCGAKVGANVLSLVLKQLQPIKHPDVLVGLDGADDSAVVRVPEGKLLVQTVDFFRPLLNDPYLNGKIAANHALGDIWAMGADAHTALAVTTIPPGLQSKVQQELTQLMTGAIEVLNSANCALVGGHTGEGKELALGFAINGLISDNPAHLMRKNGMQAGNVLILTKPLGTGTLFAALHQLAAKGRWIDAAIHSVLQSSQQAALFLQRHGATACTDVTGFGLVGHLLEMSRHDGVGSALTIELNMHTLPVLEGALECLALGIMSSLHGSNQQYSNAVKNSHAWMHHSKYPLLFDPQTAGGLLASVPSEQGSACLSSLHKAGYTHAKVIGRVIVSPDNLGSLVLSG